MGALLLAPLRIILNIVIMLWFYFNAQFVRIIFFKRLRFIIFKITSQILIRFWLFSFGVLYIKKIRVNINNNNIKHAPVVISNHRCFLDGFIVFYYFCCGFISKQDVKNYPILGSIL